MIGKPDLRLISAGEPDKSFIYTVINSRCEPAIFLARSELDAAWVAQRFDFIRKPSAGFRQPRDFIESQMRRSSTKLDQLLKAGKIGKVEVTFVDFGHIDASFYPLVSTKTTVVGSRKGILL